MMICSSCKVARRSFSQHDRFCDDCMTSAIEAIPARFHFLDRLGLAIDNLDQQSRMVIPYRSAEKDLKSDRRCESSMMRAYRIKNPHFNKRDVMYGFAPRDGYTP